MGTSTRGFGLRIGFIFSMAAFSIGIGNLWKFPYVVGNNGGGAFLLVYILLVMSSTALPAWWHNTAGVICGAQEYLYGKTQPMKI
ncbi:MAG: hypothetical protein SO016_13115 [Lachnospiraceae bacterium]|nr:hypothetical protein [Robinsoniella sp.]MDY3767604.1 hypothetical protein [Lachnospiraceae bacterium]